MTVESRRSRLTMLVGVGAWLVMLAVALPRVLGRHLHVDEVQVAYEAALVHVHHAPELSNGTGPLFAAVGFVLRLCDSTPTMFAALRFVFFVLFALRLAAEAWGQPYFRSPLGRVVVLLLATCLHQQWLNGFELRTDTAVVLGTVLLYGLVQRVATQPAAKVGLYAVAGLVAAFMQAQSGKAMAYWGPFSLLLLVIGTRGLAWKLRARAAGALVVAFGVGIALNLGFVHAIGRADLYARGMGSFKGLVDNATRFSPTRELVRLVLDSPLTFGLAVAQPVLLAISWRRRREDEEHVRLQGLVTAVFLAWSVAVLFVNPTPFPYNFTHLVPFVGFAALDSVAWIMRRSAGRARHVAIGVGALVATTSLVAWVRDPFLSRASAAQLSYARAAEALTGPDDTVLDAAGIVLMRRPPHKDWLLHSLRIPGYRAGVFRHYADILAESAPPVLLDNYRWGWLSREDLQTRKARYLQLAPHLFVLGSRLTAAEGELGIHRAGNYRITSNVPQAVTIDGVSHEQDTVVSLAEGRHPFTRGEGVTLVFWIGPQPEEAANAVEHIESLGRGEPFYTNEPLEVPR